MGCGMWSLPLLICSLGVVGIADVIAPVGAVALLLLLQLLCFAVALFLPAQLLAGLGVVCLILLYYLIWFYLISYYIKLYCTII